MNYPLYVAIVMIVGLVGGKLASKFNLPSVTGFIVFGMLLGDSFTGILTKEIVDGMSFVNDVALSMLAIALGAELHWPTLKKYGKDLPLMAIGESTITLGIVTLASWLLGLSLGLAVILGILAITVSPSGVVSVIQEYRSKGELTQNILAMVAINNLGGIVLFGAVAALLEGMSIPSVSGWSVFFIVIAELIGAIILGVVSGYVIVHFIRRRTNNSKFLVILLAILLLNTGLANELSLSALLVNMVAGVTVTNIRNRSMTLAATLDRVQLPITVVYLTLAGAKLNLDIVSSVGLIGIAYILGRSIGKVVGCYVASWPTKLSQVVRKNVGYGLTPQGGITIGLAIVAEQKIPGTNGLITGVVLTGVVVFEIFGPLLLGKALQRAGEAEAPKKNAS